LEAVESQVGQAPFAWVANKDTDGAELFSSRPDAARLPNNSHGLNGFQQYETVAFLAARNLTPAQGKFLQWCGLSANDVRTATYYHAAYQAVMRGAIRDPDNLNPKQVIVPDRGLADYLGNIFDGATIRRLNVEFGSTAIAATRGRPREHADHAVRKRAWRERQSEGRRREQSQVVPDNDAGLQT